METKGTKTVDISVIVPVYKISENYLRICIESLIAVRNTPVEIILVDDGSPDNCGVICDEYASRDDRISVIHQENQGVSVARNNGIAAAKGKWLCFVDADDWVEKNYYEMLAPYTQSLYDVLIFADYENNKKVACKGLKGVLQTASYEELCWRLLLPNKYKESNEMSSPWGKLFSREFIARHKMRFEPRLWMAEDRLFMLDALVKYPNVDCFDTYYYHHRIHIASVSKMYNPRIIEWVSTYKTYIDKRISSRLCDEIKRNEMNFDIITLSSLQSDCNRIYFFHPYNPKPYRLRRDEFFEYIENRPWIKKSIKSVKVRELRPIHAIVLIFIKLHCFFMLNFMYKLRYWLIH
ncbi:MAG: glycosyltransferase [Clostridiales Family XIII bacterium]|jgi:glycosyltransferase involved in cell wall biosynthesis|nr:glycosyltransferase [Clostridiales Family XIII bacterium]